jgi:hypothetical protein
MSVKVIPNIGYMLQVQSQEFDSDTVCPDCCEFLNFNEEEQNLIKQMNGNLHPHYCTKYSERLKHFPHREPFITKCEQCVKENKE